MSVQTKRNGALRLCCDQPGCAIRFVPLRTFTDPVQLRKRAGIYGWTFLRAGADLCPTHRPTPTTKPEGIS